MDDDKFAVFIVAEKEPVLLATYHDMDDAMIYAQQLADAHLVQTSVFSLERLVEIRRFFPDGRMNRK